MHNRGGLFLKKLQATDKNASVIPWKAALRKEPALQTDRELKKMTDLFKMDTYFNRARVLQRIDMSKKPEFNRDMWFHVFLQHDNEYAHLQRALNHSLDGAKIFTQLMPIQHESPQLLGYILGTTQNTDIPKLNHCMYKLAGNEPLGGKWFANIQATQGRGKAVQKTATDRKSWIGAVHIFGWPGPAGIKAFRQMEKNLKKADDIEAAAKKAANDAGDFSPATIDQFSRPLAGLKAKVLPDIRLINNKVYQTELLQFRAM